MCVHALFAPILPRCRWRCFNAAVCCACTHFAGRRNFSDFLSEYVLPLPGRFINVDTGADVGPCANLLALTHGQRAGIGGEGQRTYVVGKDVGRAVAYVAKGQHHPALLSCSALLRTPHWLSESHAEALAAGASLRCGYKARYGQPIRMCTVRLLGHGARLSGFEPSAYCRLLPEDSAVHAGYLLVDFDDAALAVTPQQAFVMYDGEVCIGSAPIALPGRSLHELGASYMGLGAEQQQLTQ